MVEPTSGQIIFSTNGPIELSKKIAELKAEAAMELLKEFPEEKKAIIKKYYDVDLSGKSDDEALQSVFEKSK